MIDSRPEAESRADRPLAGATGWLITDGKMGMDVQVRGVADALGLAALPKCVALTGICKLLAPWGPVPPETRFGEAGTMFSPPWPAVAIATGRASIPFIRRLHRVAGLNTFCVVLQDPKTGAGVADLIWVPEHDRRFGPNVMRTLTAPHSFSPDRLAHLRSEMPAEIAALPSPRVAVVLGGKNGAYKFTDADDDRFMAALASMAKLGASFMITPSRRTHSRLLNAAVTATAGTPRIVWDLDSPNPYPQFLAHAEMLVVTADSVNMTGEACATGRPVYVFKPSGGSAKFDRFHRALADCGATRPLPDSLDSLAGWRYQAVHSAEVIAREVERRWLRRREMLAGLVSRKA